VVELLLLPLLLDETVHDFRGCLNSKPLTTGGKTLTAQPESVPTDNNANKDIAINLIMVNFLSGKFQKRKSTLRIQGT
jgi:hypothetical protein